MKKLSSVLVLFLFIPFFTFASQVGDCTIPVEVAQLSDSLKHMYAPDKRVALFDVDYSFAGKNVMLRGVTTSAEAKAALLQGLAKADYKVMDCIQVLPDVKGLEGKTYGIINVSVANLRAAPDFSSEMMTQGLMGMPVHVLQRDGFQSQNGSYFLHYRSTTKDRKSTRLNSSHTQKSRMPSSA